MSRSALIAVALVVAALGGYWLFSRGDESSRVRARLVALTETVNRTAVDGLSAAERSQIFGRFFTEDATVELGHGAVPIRGRETLVGMAERLQPRLAAFRLAFEDVSVVMGDADDTAEVHLTLELIKRGLNPNESSLDAREFTLGMRRVAGEWQIARATAIDTLK